MNKAAREAKLKELGRLVNEATDTLNKLAHADELITEYEETHQDAYGGIPPRVEFNNGFYHVKNSNGQDGVYLLEQDIKDRINACKACSRKPAKIT